MSFLIDTTFRSNQKEILDDFTLEGEQLRDTLDKLEAINRFLGGNSVTLNGIKSLLKNHSHKIPVSIVDLGCGHGDILREVAKFGRKNNYKFQLLGIDANADAIQYAKELSLDFPEIEFKTLDIFSEKFKKMNFDIVLCTLFTHHFTNKELVPFLQSTLQNTKKGIVINDLHRHKLPYYSFKFIGLFIKNRMVREDGLTSVLRAFKKKDLEKLTKKINARASIKWKWAFRYQWILQNK